MQENIFQKLFRHQARRDSELPWEGPQYSAQSIREAPLDSPILQSMLRRQSASDLRHAGRGNLHPTLAALHEANQLLKGNPQIELAIRRRLQESVPDDGTTLD